MVNEIIMDKVGNRIGTIVRDSTFIGWIAFDKFHSAHYISTHDEAIALIKWVSFAY